MTERDFLKLVETGLIPTSEERGGEAGLFASAVSDKEPGLLGSSVPAASETD